MPETVKRVQLGRTRRSFNPLDWSIHPQIALAGIALVGLMIRFLRIGAESIWLDESFSIWAAQRSFSEMMTIAKWDPHPPLHYLLLKVWMMIFGSSEASVRGLSAVAGAGAVWAIGHLFFTVRQTETGLYAACLLAFSPMHLWFSQETRSVTLFFLAAVLATATFLRVMQQPTWRNAAFYWASAVFVFHTHAYSIFLFAALLVIYLGALWVARKDVRLPFLHFAALQVPVGILCLPWALFVFVQTKSAIATLWMKRPSTQTVIDAYELMAGSMVLLIAILALGVYALASIRRKTPTGLRVALITATTLALAMPLGGVIVSWMWRPIFLARAVIPALAGLLLLAAAGLTQLPRHLRIIGLAVMLFGSGIMLQSQLSDLTKDDWRGAVGRINTEAQPGDVVIMDAGFNRHVFDYYTNRTDLKVLDAPTFQPDFQPWLDRHNATFAGPGRVWHVRVYSGDVQQLVSKKLAENRTKTFSAPFQAITLHAWDVNQSSEPSTPMDAGSFVGADVGDGDDGLVALDPPRRAFPRST